MTGAFLVLQPPEGDPVYVSLDQRPLRIGRVITNDIYVPDPNVSRQHAQFLFEDGGFWIEDLESTNGTFVNDRQVGRHRLQHEDVIRLGLDSPYRLVFHTADPYPGTGDGDGGVALLSPDRLRNLSTLLEISRSLSSSLRLETVLDKVMDAVMDLTGAERGLLLLGDHPDELVVRVRRDATGPVSEFPYSQSVVDEVMRSGEAQVLRDAQHDPRFGKQDSIVSQSLRTVMCVPLLPVQAKAPIGVVYVDKHTPTQIFSQHDLSLFESLAGHAAVALQNARLHADLQRSSQALRESYDATLMGWARALELRDRETEGHTQRVTELTVRLARAVGIEDGEIEHIRRGALLHDIGKMGIPDDILRKPGPLTDAEFSTMQQHTVYAFEMLSPISYLREALDIPYCHHEKWDGSGYPRGLKGDEIPRAARLFALVDVWDALTSDRPYRAAWAPERTLAYIREQAGKHFDPDLVEDFAELVED